ncbi:glutaredoxin 3 [Nevskia ramosa]|uniref:glutaredoxin 3 n=1 Tax=Nevskia ramosa TaxID=64002 RepID=UPI0004181FEB|nr:glutaredoxin 3 [Nevskia ramosa]
MKPVTVYSTRICPYCMLAKRLLGNKGVSYQEIMVDQNDALRAEMMQRSGRRTVPQIFIGDRHVGGFDDLAALDRAGQLDPLLREA